MYSLFDSVAMAFTQPMFTHNDGQAMRMVANTVNGDQETALSQNPNDYTLYYIGEFDDKNAELIPADQPRRIVILSELLDNDKKIYSNSDLDQVIKNQQEAQKQITKLKNEVMEKINKIWDVED